MKRKLEAWALLLIVAVVICGMVIVDASADKLEQRAEPAGNSDQVAEQVDEAECFADIGKMMAQPFEDPLESEKIEAALDWHYIDNCTITAYCSCTACCGKDDGITATGTIAQEGVTIAVDQDVIPLGAWVEIDGNMYHAEDTGAFSGNHIDIYIADHDEAWEFGRQHANVRWYPGC